MVSISNVHFKIKSVDYGHRLVVHSRYYPSALYKETMVIRRLNSEIGEISYTFLQSEIALLSFASMSIFDDELYETW